MRKMTGKELIELIKSYHLEDYTLDWCYDHSTADGHHQQLQFFISEEPTEFVSAVGEPIRKLKYADVDIYDDFGFCKVRTMLSDTPDLKADILHAS